ncbi:hypothetical protein OG563_13395 [Nocardia vinacea]|uniref:Uncharacterized protein n=1 Tax=Nocardia vinacea TaxID=96468 RepID=A0ABZ1Z0N0_9NOCA|nr:hypothetical protein [Nocardia vinacea]
MSMIKGANVAVPAATVRVELGWQAGASPSAQQAPPINMSKISLTKDAPAVSLTKTGATRGIMRVNLNWSSPSGKGIFGKRKTGDALDLAYSWGMEWVAVDGKS